VRVDERGLPLELRLDTRELPSEPAQLAADILALCQLGAARAQVARRQELQARGCQASALRNLRLCSEADLEAAESRWRDDGIDTTYLRPL
jgi:hypothetical protein